MRGLCSAYFSCPEKRREQLSNGEEAELTSACLIVNILFPRRRCVRTRNALHASSGDVCDAQIDCCAAFDGVREFAAVETRCLRPTSSDPLLFVPCSFFLRPKGELCRICDTHSSRFWQTFRGILSALRNERHAESTLTNGNKEHKISSSTRGRTCFPFHPALT